MALSIVSIPGDGVTDTFNVSFALGILDRNSVTAWVTGEVDGGGNKVYRTITYLTDTMLKISGAKAPNGVMVVFTRTTPNNQLIVNYEDGDIMNETNLNTAQKQALMLVHQVLDGRFSAFIQDVSFGGFRGTNVGTPINPGDAANKAYVDSVIALGGAQAAAAAASAAAALASQGAAATSAGNAATSAANSLTYSNNSLTYRNAASQSATDAQAANVSAYNNYLLALASANKAQEWSDKPEDVFVTGTSEYSAYHWSRKAASVVIGNLASLINAMSNKASVNDADRVPITDSAASFGGARVTAVTLADYVITRLLGVNRTFLASVAATVGMSTGASGTAAGFNSIGANRISIGNGRNTDGTTDIIIISDSTASAYAQVARAGGTNGQFLLTNNVGNGGIAIGAGTGAVAITGASFTYAGSPVLTVASDDTRMAWFAVASATTITLNHVNSMNQSIVLAHNAVMAAPTNGRPGQPLNILLTQDATGSRIPSWNAVFDFGDAGTPVLSTGANQQDLVTFVCRDASKFIYLGIRKRTD